MCSHRLQPLAPQFPSLCPSSLGEAFLPSPLLQHGLKVRTTDAKNGLVNVYAAVVNHHHEITRLLEQKNTRIATNLAHHYDDYYYY